MKVMIATVVAILMIATNLYSATPPSNVRTAFSDKFPKATKVKWGKESATEWEAEFQLNGVKVSANFNADGSWVETEKFISYSEVPKPVAEAVKGKYGAWKVIAVELTESAKRGNSFELKLKNGKATKDVEFDQAGNELKK